MHFGLVPAFEERTAAIASGYTWPEWANLPVRERASAVAFHRLSRLIGLHSQDAVQVAMEREAARKRRQEQ